MHHVKDVVNYSPKTGCFKWKISAPSIPLGGKAGHIMKLGYVRLCYKRRTYYGHRVAWLIHYGREPLGEIDHIDGDRANNRISNLRECTKSQNAQNRAEHRAGALVGASFNIKTRKWFATAPRNYLNRKSKSRPVIGRTFDTAEAAHAAVVKFCLGGRK